MLSFNEMSHLFLQLKPSLQRGGSSASLHNSTMRNTIFQLMIHTLDPLGEGESHITAHPTSGLMIVLDYVLLIVTWISKPLRPD